MRKCPPPPPHAHTHARCQEQGLLRGWRHGVRPRSCCCSSQSSEIWAVRTSSSRKPAKSEHRCVTRIKGLVFFPLLAGPGNSCIHLSVKSYISQAILASLVQHVVEPVERSGSGGFSPCLPIQTALLPAHVLRSRLPPCTAHPK